MAANPLTNPNVPLAGRSLQQAATALTNAQLNGPLAELAKQIAANTQQGQAAQNATSGYYQGLGNYINQSNQQLGGISNDLASKLAGIGQSTQGQIGQAGQNAQALFAQHAPPGEGGLSAGALGSLAAETARQQGLAAQDAGAFQAHGAIQGANQQGLGASQLGTSALRGQEILGQIANQYAKNALPLQAKVAGLQAQRGALQASNEGKLRQQEINNQVTRAGLGIKDATLGLQQQRNQITQQNNLANQQLRSRALSVTQQNDLANQLLRQAQQKITQQNNQENQALKQAALNLKSAASGKPKAFAPATNARYLTDLGKIVDAIPVMQKGGYKNSKGVVQPAQNEQAIRTALGHSYNPVLIEAAYELLGWGHITPQTASLLHGMGLRGGSFRNAPIQVGPAPAQKTGVLGGNLFGIPI